MSQILISLNVSSVVGPCVEHMELRPHPCFLDERVSQRHIDDQKHEDSNENTFLEPPRRTILSFLPQVKEIETGGGSGDVQNVENIEVKTMFCLPKDSRRLFQKSSCPCQIVPKPDTGLYNHDS